MSYIYHFSKKLLENILQGIIWLSSDQDSACSLPRVQVQSLVRVLRSPSHVDSGRDSHWRESRD